MQRVGRQGKREERKEEEARRHGSTYQKGFFEHERIKRNCFSPLDSHQKLTRYGDSHRIVSTSGANAAYMALLAPFPMASLMDADDAKAGLTLVSEKLVARTEVKRIEADAAEALKEEKKRVRGEARAVHWRNVAQRPVKTQRTVDVCTCRRVLFR